MKKTRPHDLKAIEAISETVSDWAYYSDVEGEADSVETSPIIGTYDWRSYLEEETRAANARARQREAKQREKKPERAPPTSAPSVFYA